MDPSTTPTADPTNDPTIYPTTNPIIEPTAYPTTIPTIYPTHDPTIHPTNNPSQHPTMEPTFSPLIPPSPAPSFSPSPAPTSSPSIPTCHNAKYQGNMVSDDFLWEGESFVSDNCQYLLTMDHSGNLVLRGLEKNRRRLQTDYTWYIGWQTNTSLFNYSKESLPKFVIQDDGLYILEYAYKGWEGRTIELWSTKFSQIWSDSDDRSFTLSLSNFACLTLTENSFESNLWNECAQFPFSVGEEGITSTVSDGKNTTSVGDAQEEINLVGDNGIETEKLWWFWLLIILCILILMALCFGIRKYYCGTNEQRWITTTIHDINSEHNLAKSYDDSQSSYRDEEDELKEWIKDTTNSAMTSNYQYGEGIDQSRSGRTNSNDSIEMAGIEIMSDGPFEPKETTFNRHVENGILRDVVIMDDTINNVNTTGDSEIYDD